MKYVITVAVAFFVAVGSAAAQQPIEGLSANSVLPGCKTFAGDAATSWKMVAAANFCAGIVYGLAGSGEYLTPPEWQSCAPPTSTARQLAKVVIRYIEERPQRMHEDFRILTKEAFHNAWPGKSGR